MTLLATIATGSARRALTGDTRYTVVDVYADGSAVEHFNGAAKTIPSSTTTFPSLDGCQRDWADLARSIIKAGVVRPEHRVYLYE